MKEQHGDRIGDPMLLALFVNPADPVDRGLDRPEQRRQQRSLAIEYARHVPAERLGERGDDGAEQENLDPSDGSHGGYALLGLEVIEANVPVRRLQCARRDQKRSGRSSA